jgi:GT2 family glycosyltransferase
MGEHIAVVIATMNRPRDLAECLLSLQRQSRRPDLVVVCDASDAEESRMVCERTSREGGGFVLRYRRASSRGLTVQSNLAVDLVPDEIDYVLLADDDVVFEPDYLSLLSGMLSRDLPHAISGVAGVGRGKGGNAPLWFRGYAFIFLLGNTRAPGRVLASGVNIAPPLEGGCVEVDWLFGCAMYRRSVFAKIRFAEELAGYGLYTDVDFSMRARAMGRLMVCPSARLIHHRSAIGRLDAFSAAEMEAVNRYWLVRRHRPSPGCRIAYWWSIVGVLILHGGRALARRPGGTERLRGTVQGVRTILVSRGRLFGCLADHDVSL